MNFHKQYSVLLVFMLSLCVQSVAFAASPSESNEGLTEQKIISFMKGRDDAFVRGDVEAFVSTFADDYTSTNEYPGGKVVKLTRSETEAALKKNFPKLSNVKFSREDVTINISQDGRSASMKGKYNLKMTIADKNYNINALSTDTFELRGGKIVTTSNFESVQDTKAFVWPVAERPTDCTYFPEDTSVAQYDIRSYHSKSTLGGLFGMTNPVPFCRMYKADVKTISAIAQSIIPSLGNPIKVADVVNGFFTTDTMERSAMMAKWQDSYSITVQEAKPGDTTVRILRPLGVYQTGKGFEQNESDGYNEKWILSQITERLASGKYSGTKQTASAQPSSPVSGAVSIEDQLKKLQDLHDKKIISDEEYKAMRAKALGL